MANIRTWLEEALSKTGESLEAVVVGQHDSAKFGVPIAADENVLLPVERALAKLDIDFDNGYGGADCFPMYAWTQSRVYFIAEYDGATWLAWLPRNPIDTNPIFSAEGA